MGCARSSIVMCQRFGCYYVGVSLDRYDRVASLLGNSPTPQILHEDQETVSFSQYKCVDEVSCGACSPTDCSLGCLASQCC